MARRQSRVGSPEKLIGYGILAVLGLIAFGLAVQQARFNPAVTLSQRAPLLKGRPPAASGQALTATAQLLPEVPGFTPLLHYLDWGGNGPVLLFLAGLGCSAHIFDRFAPRFVDIFHVLALTRRGHGESDHPNTGYDIDTLTEDIRQFMDSLKIDQAILAGHSLAGVELSHFAAVYPQRVLKLVFLDAAYDRASPACKAVQEKNPLRSIQPPGANDDHYTIEDYAASIKRAYPSLAAIWGELMDEEVLYSVKRTPEGKVVDKMSDEIGKAIHDTVASYALEDTKIRAPVLSFFVLPDSSGYQASYMTEEQKAQVGEFIDTILNPYNREWIAQFRRNIPHARIVEIPQGHHYCFIKKDELVYEEMRKFLLE